MNGKQLRASILQEAIAGRLVPQNPNDEPASKLLKRIAPNATPIRDDVPYEIPDSWCWVKHNDILEISGGSQPPKSNFIDSPKDGYVRLYQIRDYGKTPAPIYVPKNMVSKFTKKGDILLARYGASIGKIFWAEDGAYNVAMAKVIPLYKPELISKKYLYLFYCGEIFQSCIRNHSRSAQAGFNKSDLNELLFPLPPLAEQKRIVAKIEELMPLVDEYEKAQEEFDNLNAGLKSKLRASLLQEAIAGRLVPQDPNDEPASELLRRINPKATPLETDEPLPQGWCAVKVKDVCLFENGYAFSSQDYRNKGTPIIRISDLVNNKVELSRCVHYQGKIDERFWVSKGDLLIALSGATTGKMGVYVSDDKAYLNQRVGNLKVIDQRILSCEYRNLFMRSKVGEILRLAYGGAQPNISGKTISDFIFPLPPLAEQKRIVEKLEAMFAVLDKLDALTA